MSSESPYMTQHFLGQPLWRNSAAQLIVGLATVMLNDITDTPNIACCVPLSSKSSRGRELVQRQQIRNQALFQSGHLVSPNTEVSWYSQFCRTQATPYPQPLTEPYIDWRIIWKGIGAPEPYPILYQIQKRVSCLSIMRQICWEVAIPAGKGLTQKKWTSLRCSPHPVPGF